MGCFQSKEEGSFPGAPGKEAEVAALKRAVWAADAPITAAELQAKRNEFWDTQPYYGGSRGARARARRGGGVRGVCAAPARRGPAAAAAPAPSGRRVVPHPAPRDSPPPARIHPPEIWDALKAAAALDDEMAKAVLEAAEVKVMRPDMSVCYDARGFRRGAGGARGRGGRGGGGGGAAALGEGRPRRRGWGGRAGGRADGQARAAARRAPLRECARTCPPPRRYELPNFVLADPTNLA